MHKLTPEDLAASHLTHGTDGPGCRNPVFGLLDNIRSLYNVGSIFRTSDGAGVSGLFLCGYTPRPPRKEIDKTSLGSVHSVPWEYVRNPVEAITSLRESGIRICVLERTAESVSCHGLHNIDFPVCLVVGNEITGVSPAFIANADLAIEIPMHGVKHSLNASVAYGIGVYELVRQWKNKGAQGEISNASVK